MKVNVRVLRRIILILALVILLGIVLMLKILSNPVDNRIKFIYDEKEGNIEKMPQNVSPLFAEYEGIIDQRSIYKAMYLFVNDIVEEYYLKFKGNFDKEKIEKYYDKNAVEIKVELGITEKKEFVDFINKLSSLKGDELKLKEYIIIPDSITQATRSTKFVLAVDYEENERVLFELYLLNFSDNTKTPINYKAADNTYIDYELNKVVEKPVTEDIVRPGKVVR